MTGSISVSNFVPRELTIRTLHGVSRYLAWRRDEFAIFDDDESERWYVTHVPSGSVLPVCFLRPVDAANYIHDLAPLRNDWVDVGHREFLRLLPAILSLGERHHGRRWRTMFIDQPDNIPNCNGYGEHAA